MASPTITGPRSQKHGVKQVWIAYDRDEAGDAAAERLKEELPR